MSQYHQGPPFPVSSSPIFPLDAHPTRPKRPSPLSIEPCLSLPTHPQGISNINVPVAPALPNGQHSYGPSPPDSARSIPADWVGTSAPVELDLSRFDPHQRRGSLGSTGTPSPYTPAHTLPSTPIGWNVPFNLVPYAPSFHESSASSGTTFFYRSPTPSARQRTNQACEKCRDRKTKCSGSRPTCVRCQARGLICEYAVEHRSRGPTKMRKRSVPSADSPMSASPTRSTFAHHPYAPTTRIDHSVWGSRSLAAKAPEGMQAGVRTSWALSDHSDESNESGGAASYEQQANTSYLGLSGLQNTGLTSEMPPPGFNPMNDPFCRPQMAQDSAVNIKQENLGAPTLRVSASMPQLKSGPYCGAEDRLVERVPSSPYSTSQASLNASFSEIYSSTPESLHSRCPSSSSSRASYSHSSADGQDPVSAGTSSTTITLGNWPSTVSFENESRSGTCESEEPLDHAETAIFGGYAEGKTPRPSSQQFNASEFSEWITGADYGEQSIDNRFPDGLATATSES